MHRSASSWTPPRWTPAGESQLEIHSADGEPERPVCSDSLACTTPSTPVPDTLGVSSTDTVPCTAADVLDASKRAFIRDTLIPAALDFLTASLSVLPVQGPLVLDAPWPDAWCFQDGFSWKHFACCDSHWPQRYRSPGAADSDYVIVLTTRPTRGSLLAWALECMADQTGRPTAGHVNLSPARVSTDPKEFAYQLSVITHEIMHALGFNANKLPFFRKPGTLEQVDAESDVISRGTDAELGKTVTKVITPNVVAAAQAHYGCFNWAGAGMELEDGGGGGTAGSHWEKRTAMYDIMNGVSERAMYKSSITLALFEDSGWYAVDYARAERLPWGNGEGCDFVTRKCSAWDTSRYFCTVEGELGCTSDMRFGAACSLSSDAISRPSNAQYFGTPFKGGTSSISDYCPYYQGYTNRDCTDPATVQFFYYGEAAGSGARCFKGTYQLRSVSAALRTHSGCLQATCDRVTNAVTVTLAATPPLTVRCPRAGGPVDLSALDGSAFVGTLLCPRADLLCSGDACSLNDCSGHGVCNPVDGTCACAAGYYGSDNYTCTFRACPAVNGTQCSGHGVCNRDTGVCEDGAGRPGCFSGFRGADCGEVGCPAAATPACPDGTCECGGRGTCAAGACTCTAGFAGSACQFTDCPSFSGAQCGGAHRGSCDTSSGICACLDGAAAAGGTAYFHGPACAATTNGTRPIVQLAYASGLGGNGNGTTYNGTLLPGEYVYLAFEVPSVDYRLQVVITSNASAGAPVRAVASYDSSGLPSLTRSDFASVATGAGAARIDFVPSAASATTSFNRLGRMVVGVVAAERVRFSLQLQRDGCAVLRCEFGTCSDGVCMCAAGWSGPLCSVPDCPGTPDCGNRGQCDAAGTRTPAGVAIAGAQPTCRCTSFYSGSGCDVLAIPGYNDASRLRFSNFLIPDASDPAVGTATWGVAALWKNSATGVVFINTSSAGELGVGDAAMAGVISTDDISNHVSGAAIVLMEMTFLDTPRADGIMLGYENSVPNLAMVGTAAVDFDVAAWRQFQPQQVTVHRIPNTGGSTLYMARVFNGRYGQERLRYSWRAEIASGACPPSMAACSGHGTCDPATASCTCAPGYRGLLCDTEVGVLDVGTFNCGDGGCIGASNVTLTGLGPGAWRYWTLDVPPTAASVTITLTSSSLRGRALLLAVFESTRSSSSLAAVTSEVAHMDIDNAGNRIRDGAVTQTLRLRRKPAEVSMLLAVKVPADSQGTFAGMLAAAAYEGVTTPQCAGSNATCTAAACHGRGAYLADASCRCELGWNDESDCASPRLSSDSTIVPAAQSLDAMCTVCTKSAVLPNGGVMVYGVPPALQKGKVLRLSATAVVGSNGSVATGTPAVFASPVLPRSIADFAAIASGPTANASMLLGASPTGMHYVAVYAHSGGTFRLAATRFDTTVPPVKPPSFATMLSAWLFATVAGHIVLAVGGSLLLVVVSGCVIQRMTRRTTSQRLEAAHAALTGFLGTTESAGTGALQQAIMASPAQHELLASRPALARLMKLPRLPALMPGGSSTPNGDPGALPKQVYAHPLFRRGPQLDMADDMLWKDMASTEGRLGAGGPGAGGSSGLGVAPGVFHGPGAPLPALHADALQMASHTAIRTLTVPRRSFLLVPSATPEGTPRSQSTLIGPAAMTGGGSAHGPVPHIAIALPSFAIAGLALQADPPALPFTDSNGRRASTRLAASGSNPAITHNPLRPHWEAASSQSSPTVAFGSGGPSIHITEVGSTGKRAPLGVSTVASVASGALNSASGMNPLMAAVAAQAARERGAATAGHGGGPAAPLAPAHDADHDELGPAGLGGSSVQPARRPAASGGAVVPVGMGKRPALRGGRKPGGAAGRGAAPGSGRGAADASDLSASSESDVEPAAAAAASKRKDRAGGGTATKAARGSSDGKRSDHVRAGRGAAQSGDDSSEEAGSAGKGT